MVRVLEHWSPVHVIREVITNAVDEAALSATAEPRISRDREGIWHIRDYGRGLRHQHLTQNENAEKLARTDLVIGKFADRMVTATRFRSNIASEPCSSDRRAGRPDLR